jgi:hypothetical protein
MHSLETIISMNEKAAKKQLSEQNQQIEEAIKKRKLLKENQKKINSGLIELLEATHARSI